MQKRIKHLSITRKLLADIDEAAQLGVHFKIRVEKELKPKPVKLTCWKRLRYSQYIIKS